ncbi:DUF1826 domain-containing protein [Francisella hispaniensis]|uniref:Succinylglutamate desuccinylase n=1 Tax=Francisella hispaniensis FSC454 TaxID=1088883 RepID=A0AAC9NPW5_9GAMM|nr:DUF1826 domain-containing protein [Francisella hispaniensis]APD51221.1 hypothetical protein FSC454_09135 [Francisella hispaniensis FSC454]KYW82937.1 hypothetical protein AUF42_06520 [Francisella hispaniensis FSC454]
MNNLVKSSKSESKDKVILSDIYKDDVNIAIWQRNLSNELSISAKNYLDIDSSASTLCTIIKPTNINRLLSQQLPDFSFKNYLIDDIANIIDMFCYLFDLKQAGLRLATINKAMCPRFHIDHVPCRLITSYSSTATEWLYNQDVDRSLLGKVDNPFIDKEIQIQKLNIGDVALLKGESWIGNSGSGLVHRSPNIIDGKTRLLLTLDFA